MSLSSESSRPLLLPQNRRLRHLQGIYLRNVSFNRLKGRAADDSEVCPGSPSKSEKLRTPQLHHAASSEALRQRPARARRRSTNLASKSPMTRQKQLELALESRAADVFFTLHVKGEEDPVYISEVGMRSTNFNFQFFDLSQSGTTVTRSAEVAVKVWAKRHNEWTFLLDLEVNLRCLNFVGTLLNQYFPPNCVIFHLIDGVYALDLPSKQVEPKQGLVLATSPYNALMKLSNLDASIQDAVGTRDTIVAQINDIIERTPPDEVPVAKEKVRLANKYLSAQRRAVKSAQARRDQLQQSIAARKTAIAEGRAAQERVGQDIEHASTKLPAARAAVENTRDQIRGQRRRICEDLSVIFPITPSSSGAALSFQICGLDLPNTDYDPACGSSAEYALSAALGHVAQLTNALQFYLSVPLPYPIDIFGSRSSIRDEISTIPDAQRSFPLFLRGGATAQYRFDYGWFLLNKNIETLCASNGLKVVDIRHTLPNLKYLLYVCSAGTDEVPERKRGGVRGLWAGKLKGRGSASGIADDGTSSTAADSRRGSVDSEALGGQSDRLRKAIGANERGSDQTPSAPSVAVHQSSTPESPTEGGTKFTLRTKGLRENVHN